MRHERWFKTTVSIVLIMIIHLAGESAAQEEGDCPLDTKLLASDGVEDASFGQSVAVSGDTIVVGASGDSGKGLFSGAAYVYRFDGSSWVEEQKLVASDAMELDSFGFPVAVEDDVILIGATGDDDSGGNSGSVYVFRHDGSAWVEEQKLLADDGEEFDYFGSMVSLSGETALIGSPYTDDGGSVYVFVFDGSSWVQNQKLVADDAETGDNFGSAVGLMGDTAVFGVYEDDVNGNDSGSAYVFRYDGSTWAQEQKLVPDDGDANEWFGLSVAIWEDTILVGAPLDDKVGAIYVYHFDGSVWTNEQKILGEGTSMVSFSVHISLCANTAVVGSFASDFALLFHEIGGWWTLGETLVAADPEATDSFQGLALVGNTAVIGVPQDSENGDDSGAVYVLVGATADCNDNGGVDGCDIATETSADCNSNSVPDECDIESGSSPDCNDNAVPDSCDVAEGTSADCNGNLILDECEDRCSADANRDCVIDPLDVGFVQARFGCVYPYDGVNCLRADVNGDGIVDPLDLGYVLSRFGPCE